MSLAQHSPLKNLTGPILITGHTGFKGTWLTLLLESLGIPVVGFSLPPEKNSLFDLTRREGCIPEVFGDIRGISDLKEFFDRYRPAAIIHLAAQSLVLESYKKPLETFETNVMGTANILKVAFETNSVEAVVIATTDKVYRNNNSGTPFLETDSLAGKDPYSASKVATEAVVAAWQQIAKVGGGPKLFSVRAGNVVGGGDLSSDRLLPDLVRGLISGTNIHIRNPRSTRPWQHVLDPLHGYLLALEAVINGADLTAVNFGPVGESLTVKEVAEIVVNFWPNKIALDFSTSADLNILESINLSLNSEFAQLRLGWKPLLSQRDAVASTIQWWKAVMLDQQNPVDVCNQEIANLFSNGLGK